MPSRYSPFSLLSLLTKLVKIVFRMSHYVLTSHSLLCPLHSHHCLHILLSRIPISSTLFHLNGYVPMLLLLNIQVVFNTVHHSPLLEWFPPLAYRSLHSLVSFDLFGYSFLSILAGFSSYTQTWTVLCPSLARGCPLLTYCTPYLVPSFKWYQHAADSQIFLSSPDLSPQLYNLQPAAQLHSHFHV